MFQNLIEQCQNPNGKGIQFPGNCILLSYSEVTIEGVAFLFRNLSRNIILI